ncbi:MAG: hypothetical protein M1818_007171 [Claussenomyces sp. TS43310]|nr:MAG: hypothetical protein M1818_007171 [Claussenomyces sp. TS43310]
MSDEEWAVDKTHVYTILANIEDGSRASQHVSELSEEVWENAPELKKSLMAAFCPRKTDMDRPTA